MNKRQVIILWAVAAALVTAVAIVKFGGNDTVVTTTQRSAGQTLFEKFPATDVAGIDLQGASGTVSLAQKDGKWTVVQRDHYPANASTINEFLRGIAELKVTRSLEAGPSLAPRFGMDEAATTPDARGVTASFKDSAGKEIAKITLGKNIEGNRESQSPYGGAMPVGRYVRNHADESAFYAISEMFQSISTEIPRWLQEDFISPEKLQSVSLSQKGKNDPAWKVSRDDENGEMKLTDAKEGESLDATAASSLKALFSYARFDDVVPADKVAERSDTANQRTAELKTFEGFTYTLTITPVKGDDTKQLVSVQVSAELPKERKKEEGEKPEDAKTKDQAFTDRLKTLTEKLDREKSLSGRTFEMAKSSLESLLKERDQILAKPATSAPAEAATPTPGMPALSPSAPTEAVTAPIEAVTPPIEVPASNAAPAPEAPATQETPAKEQPAEAPANNE